MPLSHAAEKHFEANRHEQILGALETPKNASYDEVEKKGHVDLRLASLDAPLQFNIDREYGLVARNIN